MFRQFCKTPPLLPAALMIISAAIFACVPQAYSAQAESVNNFAEHLAQKTAAQQSQESTTTKHNTRPGESTIAPASDSKTSAAPVAYTYEFSQPSFHIRHIILEHDSRGQGTITFERLNEEVPVVEPIQLSPAVLDRVITLWQSLKFLDSQEDYQSDKQFPHLGTMRITMSQGTRKRTAEFNWSHNSDATALVSEYRRVADQAVFIFDVSVARENQPLNGPKLMEQLESMLKNNWLSDPKQLIPLLKEISVDEHLPLIARNHALRLLKKIEK